MVNPDWYWGTAAEWGGSEPLPRKQASFVVESLPGGCLLYRLGVQSSLPQGRKPCGPRPDKARTLAEKSRASLAEASRGAQEPEEARHAPAPGNFLARPPSAS